ncbi:hypothetical protein [Marinicella meishanensis]|uniref:hypothetical protein n=1 Tax=Marinicella meishanensis TaxID=2873263 RepID=UPI001CC19608|nr:hypothetical protein [Marinicella sp. NBU2979]
MSSQSYSHRGMVAEFRVTDATIEIDVRIKGWVRRRHYQLVFHASTTDQLRSALLSGLDASSYQELADNWMVKVENVSWRMFGFHRTHRFPEPVEFPVLAYADEISLMGMKQKKSRPQTQITDAFIGHRKGEKYLLLRVGRYVSSGIGNNSGSTPDTAVMPLSLLNGLLKVL